MSVSTPQSAGRCFLCPSIDWRNEARSIGLPASKSRPVKRRIPIMSGIFFDIHSTFAGFFAALDVGLVRRRRNSPNRANSFPGQLPSTSIQRTTRALI